MNFERNKIKNKPAVALMITLAIIAVMTQIIYLTFTYLEKTKKSDNEIEQLIQANITIKNIEKMVIGFMKDINSSKEIKVLYELPIVFDLENNATISLTIQPDTNVINVNKLIDKNGETNESYRMVFDNILLSYEIDNPHLFMDLLLDTIDRDDVSRSYQTEIKEVQPLFNDGGVINLKHFKQILDYYYKKTDDKKIYKIRWEEYIGFSGDKIDFNFISPELLTKLDDGIGEEKAKEILNGKKIYKKLEDINLEKDIINNLKKFPLVFFNLSFICSGSFTSKENGVGFSFHYDKKNKVTQFELIN